MHSAFNLTGVVQELQLIKSVVLPPIQQVALTSQALIGDYKYSARSNDHLGWLKCDGRALSNNAFPALFEVVGTSFGSNSASNFYLPDFRSRVPGVIGQGSGLTNRARGLVVGAETHTLTVNEIPSHDHGGTTEAAGYGTSVQGIFAANSPATNDAVDNVGSHSHSISSQGGGQAHNNMQPTLFGGNIYIFAGVDYPQVDG
jgi:microcystin-dependent protein